MTRCPSVNMTCLPWRTLPNSICPEVLFVLFCVGSIYDLRFTTQLNNFHRNLRIRKNANLRRDPKRLPSNPFSVHRSVQKHRPSRR